MLVALHGGCSLVRLVRACIARRGWQGHKKEIREREETIADKDKRIYDLKKKNQEVRPPRPGDTWRSLGFPRESPPGLDIV